MTEPRPHVTPSPASEASLEQEIHPLWAGVWMTLNLALGLLPSLLFFVWMERNATLPVIPRTLGWPWVNGFEWPVAVKLLWNAGWVGIFGAGHSVLASPFWRNRLLKFFPIQTHRTLYIIVAGLSLTLIPAFWQNTGIVLWALPIPAQTLLVISPIAFWGLFLPGFSFVGRQGFLHFFGFRQLFESRRELLQPKEVSTHLVVNGAYRYVRHPLYTFTLAAILLAPFMTMDRFWVFLMFAAYLRVGIPLEEKKLVAEFGDVYERYRQTTPAVIPVSFRRRTQN